MMKDKIIRDYRFKNLIGRGAMGDVYLATHIPSNLDVAIKVIPRKNSNSLSAVMREVQALSTCNHPYIVKFFEFFSDGPCDFIVQEYLSGGTFLEFINKMFELKEEVIRHMFVQIVLAVQYMHETVNLVHRDIKAENILLDEHNNIRFIDFGFSRASVCDILKTACGTPAYAAPEMIEGKKYGPSVDVWSLGVLLYSACYKRFPFRDENVTALFDKILKNDPALGKKCSPELRDLIGRLLEKDPEKRITISEILVHPWIRNTPMMMSSYYYQSIITEEMVENILKRAAHNKVQRSKINNHGFVSNISYEIAKREALKHVISMKNTKNASSLIRVSLKNTLQFAGRNSSKTRICASTFTNYH